MTIHSLCCSDTLSHSIIMSFSICFFFFLKVGFNGNLCLKMCAVGRQNQYACEKEKEKGSGGCRGFTQLTTQFVTALHLFQEGVERAERKKREQGRAAERGRGRQTPTPRHLRWARGGKGGSQWEGLCEAQPTCWSSVPGPTLIVDLRKARYSREPKHVAKTIALRCFGCVPRDANMRWI